MFLFQVQNSKKASKKPPKKPPQNSKKPAKKKTKKIEPKGPFKLCKVSVRGSGGHRLTKRRCLWFDKHFKRVLKRVTQLRISDEKKVSSTPQYARMRS